MDANHDPLGNEPVVAPGYTYGSVTDKISLVVLSRPISPPHHHQAPNMGTGPPDR